MSRGHWESYDATDGINGTVYAIQQDREGNLWFATSHCGVTRYDGEKFIHFTTSEGLPHNTVWAMIQDRNGDLWFGTERGIGIYSNDRLTNLTRDRKGLFEVADGGTLLLDEIGDMHQELQARLLRILGDGEVKRVGDSSSKRVNVRVIAATNKDLWAEVSAGRFRKDLYYRLAAYPITVPPLRERRGDIPALAEHFLKTYNESTKRRIKGVEPEAMSLLIDYPWPGNVRELENEVRRAATLAADNSTIASFMLSDRIRETVSGPQVRDDKTSSLKVMMDRMKAAMDRAERDLILEVLERNHRNITRTAAELGISRVTLQKKMKKYQLREE